MSPLVEQVCQSIRWRGLFRAGQRVVVAVSGGLDSMVLLHVLRELAQEHSCRLTVAHFNHRLRGRSSQADERFVVRLGAEWKVPVITGGADVRSVAAAEKISIEMAARRLRHDFLARTARQVKAPVIALAHHADDQVELFFLRLLRGSGGEGLAGMKWRGPSPADAKITLVRPLLNKSKSMLQAYARENKVPFREDASNAARDIQRNRVRHELLPLLRRDYQPALERTILRVMDIVGADAELSAALAMDFLAGDETGQRADRRSRLRRGNSARAKQFTEQPVAVQRRVIQMQLHRHHLAGEFDLVERLRTAPDRAISVSPDRAVRLDTAGRMWVERTKAPATSSQCHEISLMGRKGKLLLDGVEFRWRIVKRRGGGIPATQEGRELFDADRVGKSVRLRHWRPGDRFQPIGAKSAVKLQDIFVNQKIARWRRHELIVAEAENGEIFWVENVRISDRFKLCKGSSRALEWLWKRV